MSALLAGIAAALAVGAIAELWSARGDRLTRLARRSLVAVGGVAGSRRRVSRGRLSREALELRIRRAGIAHRIDPGAVLAARAVCAAAAVPPAFHLAALAPARSGLLVLVLVPGLAALGPDLLLERRARARRRKIERSLADALELMAVGTRAGRGGARLVADAARLGGGPVGEELGLLLADIRCGVPQREAVAGLADRAGGELAQLAALMERSRRLGSPLAPSLERQAAGLREREARATTEQAARAAPKIQLVVALLLVPSVLLVVGAALVANLERLLPAF